MTHMWIDALLAFLAWAIVVIAVVGDARKAKKKIDRFGVATIGVATLIFLFTIAHGWNGSKAKAEYVAQLDKLRAQLEIDATRLRPTDFQSLLVVDYPGDVDGDLPERIAFSGAIGEASFRGTFEKSTDEPTSKAEGLSLGTHSFYYNLHKITFVGLNAYQYLRDVDRQPFVLKLDIGKLPRGRRETLPTPVFFLTVIIQGQDFEARSIASGKFDTAIRLEPANQAK